MKFEGAVCVQLSRCISAVNNFRNGFVIPSKEIKRKVDERKKIEYASFNWWMKLWYEDFDDACRWEYYKMGQLNFWAHVNLATSEEVEIYKEYEFWLGIYYQVGKLTSVSSEQIYLNPCQAAFVDKWEAKDENLHI